MPPRCASFVGSPKTDAYTASVTIDVADATTDGRKRPLSIDILKRRWERLMKILVVDDSSVMRKIVIRTLRQAGFGGHDVEEAVDGKDALEKIAADEPDLVLTDWNMPEMTGIELAHALKEKELDLPLAFITSECTTEMREEANRAGAITFLTKPFTPESLETAFKKILG